MKAHVIGVLIVAGIFVSSAQGALIIDHFQSPQSSQTANRPTGGGGNTASSTLSVPLVDSSATTIANLDREFFVNRTQGGSNTGVSLTSPVGTGDTYAFLNITPNNAANRTAYGTIVYEAASSGDTTGENPNVFSLDLNFLAYGSALDVAGFLSGTTAPSPTAPIIVTLYGSGVNSNSTASAIFNLTSTSPDQVVSVPFNLFTGFSESLFNHVGAIRVQLGSTTGNIDVSLNSLSVTGPIPTAPIPEPASTLLIGGGLVGLLLSRVRVGFSARRINKG